MFKTAPKIHTTNPTWYTLSQFHQMGSSSSFPFAKLLIRICPDTISNLHSPIPPPTVQADQRSYLWRLLLPWCPLLLTSPQVKLWNTIGETRLVGKPKLAGWLMKKLAPRASLCPQCTWAGPMDHLINGKMLLGNVKTEEVLICFPELLTY